MTIPSFILEPAINIVMPTVVSAVAAVIYQKVKKGVAWLDDPSRTKIHEYVFGAIAILQPILLKYAPGFDPAQIESVSQPQVQALVALAAGKLVHAILKK